MTSSTLSPSSTGFGTFLVLFGGLFIVFPLIVLLRSEQDLNAILAVGIFMLFGLGAIGAGIFFIRKARMEKNLVEAHPDQPWMRNKEWAAGRIRDSNRLGAFFLTAFAVFWLGFSGTIAVAIWNDESADAVARWIILIFLMVGLGLAIAALVGLLRLKKFGVSEFVLSAVPGVAGGSLGGVVLTKVHLHHRDGFTVRLKSIHRVTTGSGKNSSTQEHLLWEEETRVSEDSLAEDKTRSAVPVYFEIPYDCEPTRREHSRSEFLWRLEIAAKVPGLDYQARFVVPVFKTAASRETFTSEGAREPKADEETLEQVRELRLLSDRPGELVFERSPRARRPGQITASLFGGGLVIAAGVIHHFTGGLVLPLLLAAFGILILTTTFYCMGVRHRVQVRPGWIEIERRGWGKKMRKAFPSGDVERLEPHAGTIINGVSYYDIVLHPRTGRKTTFRLGIPSIRTVRQLIRRIETIAHAR